MSTSAVTVVDSLPTAAAAAASTSASTARVTYTTMSANSSSLTAMEMSDDSNLTKDSSSSSSSSASSSSTAVTSTDNLLLDLYLQDPRYITVKQEAADAYDLLHTQLHKAREARDNFVTACNQRKPLLQLPHNLQLRLNTTVRFVTVPGIDDAFYKKHREDLDAVDKEATKKIYDIMLDAKQKLIDHLEQQLVRESFTASRMAILNDGLKQLAAEFTSTLRAESSSMPQSDLPASLSFPVESASKEFLKFLTNMMTETSFRFAQDIVDRRKKAKHKAAADESAKDHVMTGASTGETIAAIAVRAMKSALRPISAQVDQLKVKQNRTQQTTAQLKQKINSQTVINHQTKRAFDLMQDSSSSVSSDASAAASSVPLSSYPIDPVFFTSSSTFPKGRSAQ